MPMRLWFGLHQYEVTCVARTTRPDKVTVHTGGRRWRTIWRTPEPRSDLVKAILARHSLKAGHKEAAKVFTKEKYPVDLRLTAPAPCAACCFAARDMRMEDILTELAGLNARIDAFEAADDDDVCHGGSPGEGMYERHDELTREIERRHHNAAAAERI